MILNISSLLFFYKKVKILIFLTTTEKKITSWWTNIYWLDLCGVGKNNLPDQCENDGNEFYWVFLSKFVTRLIQMNNTSWREIYWTCIWINDQKKISLNVDFFADNFLFWCNYYLLFLCWLKKHTEIHTFLSMGCRADIDSYHSPCQTPLIFLFQTR